MRKLFAEPSRRALLAGFFALAVTTPAPASPGARIRFGRPGPAPSVTLLGPSPQFNGTENSGFGGANPPVPTDSALTTAKPTLAYIGVPWQRITGNVALCFDGEAKGGIAYVRVWLEGAYKDVFTKTWSIYTDCNGLARVRYGYHVTLDYAALLAVSATGTARCYAEAVANDVTMQHRVIGLGTVTGVAATDRAEYEPPLKFMARSTAYDGTLDVGLSLTDSAGVRYNTLLKAWNYIRGRSTAERWKVIITESGRYDVGTVTSALLQANEWTTITTAPGVTANIGGYTRTTLATPIGLDGLHWQGAGIVLELAALSTGIANAFRVATGSDGKFWFDGCEITTGVAHAPSGGVGSGATALIYGSQPFTVWITGQANSYMNLYATDANVHDIAGDGISYFQGLLNVALTNCSGSALQNPRGWMHGVVVDGAGGVLSGLRTHTNVFELAYVGAQTIEYEKTSTTSFTLYVNGVANTLTFTGGQTSSTTQMAAVVSWLNGLGVTGLVATMNTPAPAFYLWAGHISEATDTTPSTLSIPRQTLASGATKQFTQIADIHADGIVLDSPHKNHIYRFVTIKNLVGGANIALRDPANTEGLHIFNFIAHDGWSGYIPSPQASEIRGGLHFILSTSTLLNSSCIVYANTFDAYSVIDHVAFEAAVWSGSPDTDLVASRNSYRTNTTPSGATNALNQASAAWTTLLADPNGAVAFDFRPIGAGLQHGDGSWVGGQLPAAAFSAANQGWNLIPG